MSSGASAGLVTREAMAAEAARREHAAARERKRAARMGGPGEAATVYRDAEGRVVDRQDAAPTDRRAAREKRKRKRDVSVVKAVRGDEAAREAYLKEAGAKLARYAGEGDGELALREQVRWDDPMKRPEKPRDAAAPLQDAPAVNPLLQADLGVYKGPPPPPCRFRNAPPPGVHWDGVERGNGFEARLLAKRGGAGQASSGSWGRSFG